MAEALIAGAVLGAAFGELLKRVVKTIESCAHFKKTLLRLLDILVALDPIIEEIRQHNNELGRRNEELESLLSLMEEGKQLVSDCSLIPPYDPLARARHEKKLQHLIKSLDRFIAIDLQLQAARDLKETLLLVRKICTKLDKLPWVKAEEDAITSSSHDSTAPVTGGSSASAKPNIDQQLKLLCSRFGIGSSFTTPFGPNYSMKPLAKVLQSSTNGNENAVTQKKKKEVMIEGVLYVTVISAENLPSNSDPFVVLTLVKENSQAQVEKQTMVVICKFWNQTFVFVVEDGLNDMLVVEVWDHDTFPKEFIGRCTLSFTRVMLEEEYKERLKLVGAESSYLNLHLKWMHHPIYSNFLLHDVELKPVGLLKVKLLQAKELTKTHIFRKSFAVLYIKPLCDKKEKSETFNCSNPIWNERFEFTVEDVSTKHLIVEVYNSKHLLSSEKLIGCAQIRLSELQPGKVKYVWSKLVKSLEIQRDGKNRGEVHMELFYCPFGMEDSFTNPFAPIYSMTSSAAKVLESSTNGIEANGNENAVTQRKKEGIIRGVLSVTVISAEDLPALDFRRKSDPFVVLTLREAKSKAETIRKTSVVNQNLNPNWNETFDFVVEDGLHDMVIVEVWDKDSFGKDYMGRCILSLTKVILEGKYTESFELVGAKSGSLKLHLKWIPQPIYRNS